MTPSFFSASFFAGLSYPALVIAGVVAQPYASLVTGSLAAAGIFSLWVLFLIFFLTDIVMDCIWYILGMRHGERALVWVQKIVRVKPEDLARLPGAFHRHPAKILVTAKLLGGFGMMPFILFTAGASKMPFGKYLALNAFGEIFWAGGFLLIGYYFGGYVMQIQGGVERITVAGLAILALVLFYWIGRRLYPRIMD